MPSRGKRPTQRQSREAEIARGIESLRDRAVREALSAAAGRVLLASDSTWDQLSGPLLLMIGLIPEDAEIGDAAAAVARRAREIGWRTFAAGDKEGFELRVLAIAIDCMSSVDPEADNPCIRWIEDNRDLLDERGRSRITVIGKVMASGLPPSLFRLHKIDGCEIPQFFWFDTASRDIQDLVLDAASCCYRAMSREDVPRGVFRAICSTFAESLGGDVPSRLEDFGARHVAAQLAFHRDRRKAPWALAAVYQQLIKRQGPDSRLVAEGVTADYVRSAFFAADFLAGYRAVMLSTLDQAPPFDRWVVYPNGTEDSHAAEKPNRGTRIDFCRIDKPLREFAKQWCWELEWSLGRRKKGVEQIALFLEWRAREIASFVNVNSPYLIKSEEVELYVKSIAGQRSSSINTKAGVLRSFVAFLEEHGDGIVDPLCPYVLSGASKGSGDRRGPTRAASPKHCKMIEDELERRATESLRDLLQYTAFLLLSYTNLRVSSILDLKRSHVVATARPGLYAIRQPSKMTGRDSRGHQIHPKIKRAIDRAIRETQGLRDAAPKELRDYVFLIASRRGEISVLADTTFKSRLERLCLDLGIPRYVPADIRRRYMTDVDSASDELDLGQAARNAAGGHADPNTSPTHYIRHDDVEYYEALYGVEVGTAKIRGAISASKPESASDEDLVAAGSGWCDGDDCSLSGIVSCLMCSHFRTSPSQIPAFKANIEMIDRLIAERETDHDRGHLAAYKALNVSYVCELEAVRRSSEGGDEDGGRDIQD